MWHSFHYFTVIFFTFKITATNTTFLSKKLPLCSWECVNERCVPTQATNSSKSQSLPTCNMLCSSVPLWPHPTGPVSLSTTAVPVRSDLLHIKVISAPSKTVHKHLLSAFQVFRQDLHQIESGSKAVGIAEWRILEINIRVNESGDPRMKIDTDESYTIHLQVKHDSSALTVDIQAKSFCGAVQGLGTLLQMVWFDPYVGSLLTYEVAKIEDAPKLRYRGLMLDTARNYYPVNDLLRTIDAMATCKLNTFHWHASDSQGFSLRLASLPEFADDSPNAVYTADDVRKVVKRARLRGIRVLIEIEAPAHVGIVWNSVQSEDILYCNKAQPWPAYCSEPPCGQLNPRNPLVYEHLEKIYGEIIQLTGVDDMFHLGGNQISLRCWEENINDTDPMELWVEFTRNTLQRLRSANGKLPNITMLWTSHLTERLKTDLKSYVHSLGVQAQSVEWLTKYVSGIRTVISHEDAWDLNSGIGSWYGEGVAYNSWQRVYEQRPWSRRGLEWIQGGEATVWSSSLDPGGIDARVWPRAAALAERLWSDRTEGASRYVHARLDVHRSRLVARGVRATPLWSMWCTQNPFACG